MNDNKEETGGALKEGRRAAAAGEATSNNPFPRGSAAYVAWLDGWKEMKATEGNTAPDDN